jgi:tRNA 2-selenouridine synthase
VEGRVERILRDYVVDLCAEFIDVFGEQGQVLFAERLTQSLANIHKRLGGERFQRLQAILQQAWRNRRAAAQWTCIAPGLKGFARVLRPDVRLPTAKQRRTDRVCGEQGAVMAYLRERALIRG